MSNHTCYHCQLPALPQYTATIKDQTCYFCCVGCQACAQIIIDGGLSDFYQFRDNVNTKANETITDYEPFDLPAIYDGIVQMQPDGQAVVRFFLPTITCAACVWLIENYLNYNEAIINVTVNGTTQHCVIAFNANDIRLSEVMSLLAQIGYPPELINTNARQEHYVNEQKTHLLRMGLAGLAMMQIGMVSAALYSGAIQGIEPQWQWLLRWTNLFFAIPVMVFSAKPFFINAMRAIRLHGVNMDVPVSIALLLAFVASVYATITNTGEVYYDSISMFTFFLLLGRYIEKRIRFKNQSESLRLFNLLPVAVQKIEGSEKITAALSQIKVGEYIWVGAGETIPCDGVVTEGKSTADEALLTGESTPQVKTTGSEVIAGSINGDSGLNIKVTATGAGTQLADIERIVDQAEQNKPAQILMADKLSGYFVAALLIVTVVVGVSWWFIDSSKALWVVLSLLVVTCPCALSLATPAAVGAAINRLRQHGFLIRNAFLLEILPQVDVVVFDKTGTLTQGKFTLESVDIINPHYSRTEIIELCAVLERYSHHPIAEAFKQIPVSISAKSVEVVQSFGVKGEINKQLFCFGKAQLAYKYLGLNEFDEARNQKGVHKLCLANADGVIAWLGLNDSVRPSAIDIITRLKQLKKQVILLSGDINKNVSELASELGITHYQGEMSAQEKLTEVEKLQAQGKKVLFVGDGINDAPVLSCADVSVAMYQGSHLTKSKADSVLVNGDLSLLNQAMHTSIYTKKVIKQNFSWAIGYNLVALPLAGMGLVPPYLAAIGMSLSSLIVVLNSLRIGRD